MVKDFATNSMGLVGILFTSAKAPLNRLIHCSIININTATPYVGSPPQFCSSWVRVARVLSDFSDFFLMRFRFRFRNIGQSKGLRDGYTIRSSCALIH
jgi:hypothetical protein